MPFSKPFATVSHLEAYRRFLRGWGTFDGLINHIVHKSPLNDHQAIARALNDAIHEKRIKSPCAYPETLSLPCEGFKALVELPRFYSAIPCPNVPTIGEWNSDSGLRVTGRVDAVSFKKIYLNKLVTKETDYKDALSWRIYLLMFNADQCTFNIFYRSKIQTNFKNSDRTLKITKYDQRTVHPYKEMTAEINALCLDYRSYVWPSVFKSLQKKVF